jgi:hypothetical protein
MAADLHDAVETFSLSQLIAILGRFRFCDAGFLGGLVANPLSSAIIFQILLTLIYSTYL